MKNRRKRGLRVAAMVVAAGSLTAGCAAPGYNGGSLQRRLVATGVSATAARCVVDRMSTLFGDRRLGARADATTAELQAERALLRKCGVHAHASTARR